MLSVIELAQLLTGALDVKFNIINKAAVVQVVSCLEAFNITHESYREVQNTRIIKDLQALRQNKGNEQILAKRIKNLLRKWKDRLASTTAPMIHSSQPNSPQNMSQGSSDTQFMTHTSQSPPISHLLNHHRAVNGPTSFSNLLPKQQQHPQNHHHLITLPITSPAPIPHLNGTATSQESLLGKRKLDAVTGSGDMDENSNHSRKKMMKKSNASAISSPLNHINHQINNNTTPIPAVPAPQQPEDAPKKRGRKKGSKGIDSMLNGGSIPDFQKEIQKKIALSAGKRNKTTMELQQMITESHHNTAMSWTNGDIDSSSLDRGFNSLSSHHPLEASQAGDFKDIKVKQEPGVVVAAPLPSTSQKIQRSLTIEEEISRLRAQLPPIDYEAAALDTFEELNTIDEYGEPIECTCTFREVITFLGDDEKESVMEVDPPKINVNIVKNGDSGKPPAVEPDSDDDETDDFCAVDDVDEDVKSPIPVRGAVKSIFDPEYDANENLIEEMVRRKPRDHSSKVIEIKVGKSAVKASRIEPMMLQQQQQPEPTPEVERVPITNYVCDEDPMCPARAHFHREPVSNVDVERLHLSSINGVNGFWNGIPEEKPAQDYAKDMENIEYAKHQLWKRVVPRYNFLTCDKIPKTFDDDSPLSLPPPAPEVVDETPSDGIAKKSDIEFREWHEIMNVRSYNDDVLTILPYVIID